MEKSILLFSGGIDSLVAHRMLTHRFGEPPKTLYYDLNVTYTRKELRAVQSIFPDTIIDYSFNLSTREEGEKAYIPFRNLLFACQAAKYSDSIIMGGLKDDMVSDKNEDIFKEFSALLSKLEDRLIDVWSPLWKYTKADAVKWYLENGGTEEIMLKTVSCYSGEAGNYCGKCPSCFRKWNALWENDIKLDFHNKNLMQEYRNAAFEHKYIHERNESIIKCVDEARGSPPKSTEIFFDLDGTLTQETHGYGHEVYRKRTPIMWRISNIKRLYDSGHRITIYTSRHEEDREVTEVWLQACGVYYHRLILGKPKYDYLIDDKAFNVNDVNWETLPEEKE